jgi:uncharacterized membrane protein YkgB
MTFQREPLAIITAIITVIEMLLPMLVVLNVVSLSADQIAAIMAFVVALGGLAGVFFVRPRVTPVADPRNNEGKTLVPVTDTLK